MPNPPIESTIDVLSLRDRLSAKAKVNQRSEYRGVKWLKGKNRWRMVIRHGGKECTREFRSQEAAARAYDVASRLLRGSDAPPPNFDGKPPSGVTVSEVRQWLIKRGMLAEKPSSK